jgi:GH25 family lysozyme M1 (1,4-beta-N-acetylmuramidase)
MGSNLAVINKYMMDAKAGLYKPRLRGKINSLYYPYERPYRELSLLTTQIDVVDISFYQDRANFAQMKRNGIRGAIMRAGQNVWEDTHAETFMTGAEAEGIPVGSYWFYDSRVSYAVQAEKWAEVLGDHKTPLLCWADYEENYGGQYRGWDYFYNFLESCKHYMPNRRFGIYTGYYYWIENSPNPITQPASLAYFGDYPLWEAWYAPDVSYVRIPRPWTKMMFWQRSSSGDGNYYGVGSREIDMNLFMGTEEEFVTLTGVENGETEMPEINWIGRVINGPAIVRETPAGQDTGQRIATGTEVKATGTTVVAGSAGYSWRNLVLPYQGWVADHLLDGETVSQPAPQPSPLAYITAHYTDGTSEKFVRES